MMKVRKRDSYLGTSTTASSLLHSRWGEERKTRGRELAKINLQLIPRQIFFWHKFIEHLFSTRCWTMPPGLPLVPTAHLHPSVKRKVLRTTLWRRTRPQLEVSLGLDLFVSPRFLKPLLLGPPGSTFMLSPVLGLALSCFSRDLAIWECSELVV